jgi:hypothetical protein
MLFKEITATYYGITTKHTNTLYEKNTKQPLLNIKVCYTDSYVSGVW